LKQKTLIYSGVVLQPSNFRGFAELKKVARAEGFTKEDFGVENSTRQRYEDE
jgi:hypothetical protein